MTAAEDQRDPVVLRRGVGILTADGPAKVLGFSRNASGALTVLLDRGDRTQRCLWSELIGDVQTTIEASSTVTPDRALVSELSETEREDIEHAARHLRQVLTGSTSGTPDQDRALGLLEPGYDPHTTTRAQRIERKAREMKRANIPGWSRPAIYRKLNAFQRDGMVGLIHGARQTAVDYLARFDPRVIDTVRALLESEKPRARRSRRAQVAIVRAELTRRELGEDLTAYALEKIIAEVSRGLSLHHDAAGRHRQGIKPKRVYGTRPVSRPGEMVQIDATRTNVHLRGPDGRWLPGNILTGIDVASRDVAALRVIVGAVSARDVGLLLFDMCQPALVRAGYPFGVVNEHGRPQHVVVNASPDTPQADAEMMKRAKPWLFPTTILMDRGPENVSGGFMATCTRVGIDVIWTPPGAGYAKGFIESLQRGDDYIASLFDSYKGASPENHPKGVEEQPQFTRGMLEDALREWYTHVYRHLPHRGLMAEHGPGGPRTPAEAFTMLMNNGGHIELEPNPWAYLDFLPETTARVQDYGLIVAKRLYASPDTVELRRHAQSGIGARARDLPVRYDPYNDSQIFVRHPTTGAWLCVPAYDRQQGTCAPYSDMPAGVDPSSGAQRVRRPLTTNERVDLEAELRTKFTDRADSEKNARLRTSVALSRREVHALDLLNAGDAVLDLVEQAAQAAPGGLVEKEAQDGLGWSADLVVGHDTYRNADVQALLGDCTDPLAPRPPDERVRLYVVADDDEDLGVVSYDADEDRIDLDDYHIEDFA